MVADSLTNLCGASLEALRVDMGASHLFLEEEMKTPF